MRSFYKIAAIVLFLGLLMSCAKETTAHTKTDEIQTGQTESSKVTEHSESNLSSNTSEVGDEMSANSSNLSADISNLNIDINLAADQLFDFDKAILKPEAEGELTKAYSQFENQPKAKVTVVGYTDGKGSVKYNKNLSLRRANAVKDWFQKKGSQNSIFVEGRGADNPIAPNTNPDGSDNPEGRAKNRRVEIKVTGEKSI